MGYTGVVVPIPLGQGGLYTDDSPSSIPPTNLIVANNITMHTNLAEKMGGSQQINLAAFTGGVYALQDFWPTTLVANQKVVLLAGNGKTYALFNDGSQVEITAAGGAPATLGFHNQVFLLPCGAETVSGPKKLFLFTGSNPVQVISGTTNTRSNIASPPVDWAGVNQPSFGILYRNFIFAGGNLNSPHEIYQSLSTNHEDFTGVGSQHFFVFPGEGEKLVGATIYKGRLFVFKYPNGVYYLDDADSNPANWFFQKSAFTFGFASAHSVIPVLNDVLVKNSSDGVTSVAATQEFGDIQSGDVLSILKIEQYVRDNTNPAGATATHGIFYPDKKLAMFTYQSTISGLNDRILMFRIDVSGKPKATFVTKDAPNCMAVKKDSQLIERPIYGSLDGFVYQMDLAARDVAGKPYIGELQTPQLDFGFVDPKLAGKNKNFDFLEIRYIAQGAWNIYADINIDGNTVETIAFPMTGDALLGDTLPDPNDFILASSSNDPSGSFLAGNDLLSVRKPLHGTGRTISVRLYNSGLDQTFKLATMIFSFRVSGEQQR